jgi:hypothetical protein
MKASVFSAAFAALSLLHSAIGSCQMFAKKNVRFEWLATESAPAEYPMRILNGTLYYHNDKGGLYVPEAAWIRPGWGTGSSTHVVGEDFKALPDRLDIRFFSFAENKLYRGSFDLPYEKLLGLFQSGVATNRVGIPYPNRATFNRIMVGVAPGGSVAVWVKGQETREVFFGQAEPYDDVLTDTLNNEIDDRDAYVRRVLEEGATPAALEEIRAKGVPISRWAGYRKQYRWLPTFVQAQRPKYISVSFFNGESYRLNFPLGAPTEKESRPGPLLMSFAYSIAGETTPDFYTIRFNDEEIYAAFARLGANGEMVKIEFDPVLPKQQTKVRIYNSKESIQLVRFTVDEN